MSAVTGSDRILAIVGATGTGKTGVAIEVARELGGEIISLDSRQAYRGMEVGTSAPTPPESAAAPHHGVGFLDPGEPYGAGRFSRAARRWIGEIRGRGAVPILVGGTGLFLRALTEPLFREPPMEESRRRVLRQVLDGLDDQRLERWVRRLDPQRAVRRDPFDRQRASRTLELALLSGHPLSWWVEHGVPAEPPLDVRVCVLELERDVHRARLRDRVVESLDGGWAAEVEALIDAGHASGPAFDAIGYREVRDYTRGEVDRSDLIESIFLATWAYARRQRTWFRHQLPETAFRLDADQPTVQLARRIIERARGDRAPVTGGAFDIHATKGNAP